MSIKITIYKFFIRLTKSPRYKSMLYLPEKQIGCLGSVGNIFDIHTKRLPRYFGFVSERDSLFKYFILSIGLRYIILPYRRRPYRSFRHRPPFRIPRLPLLLQVLLRPRAEL